MDSNPKVLSKKEKRQAAKAAARKAPDHTSPNGADSRPSSNQGINQGQDHSDQASIILTPATAAHINGQPEAGSESNPVTASQSIAQTGSAASNQYVSTPAQTTTTASSDNAINTRTQDQEVEQDEASREAPSLNQQSQKASTLSRSSGKQGSGQKSSTSNRQAGKKAGKSTASIGPIPKNPDAVDGLSLLANHFAIKVHGYRTLFKYDLSFERQETEKEQKKRKRQEREAREEKEREAREEKEREAREKKVKERDAMKQESEDARKEAPTDDPQDDPGVETTDAPAAAPADEPVDEPYVVTFFEVQPARAKRRRIVWILMKDFIQRYPETPLATDYFEQMISAIKLPVNADKWYETVEYYDEYEFQAGPQPEIFKVTVSGPLSLSLTRLVDYLSTDNTDVNGGNYVDRPDTIRALNTIFSYRPYQRCFRQPNQPLIVGNGVATPTLTTKNGTKFWGIATGHIPPSGDTETGKGSELSTGLVVIPGFARSVRSSFSNHGFLALNINTASSIFYQYAGNLQELLNPWTGSTNALNRYLKNLNVRTNFVSVRDAPYQGRLAQNFIGRVTGIATLANNHPATPANCTMTWPAVPVNQTVADYFLSELGLDYRNANLKHVLVAMLGDGHNAKTVPADLLIVIPGQRNLNTNEKPSAGIRDPLTNRALVRTGRQMFLGTNASEGGARQFHLDLSMDLLRVPIKSLKIPSIFYNEAPSEDHPTSRLPPSQNSKAIEKRREEAQRKFTNELKYGSWNLSGRAYVQPVTASRWTHLELRLQGRRGLANGEALRFQTMFDPALRRVGMSNWTFVPLLDNHVLELPLGDFPGCEDLPALKTQLDRLVQRFTQIKQEGIRTIIVFLPGRDIELYSAVKRAGDQEVGITTICHVTEDSKTPEIPGRVKTDAPFLANLTMKVNLKGGPSAVNQALKTKDPILDLGTMVIGIDVTHPGGNAFLNSPSIAAVVGSVDPHFAQWPASLSAQDPEPNPNTGANEKKQAVENVVELEVMIQQRLMTYFHRNNNQIPTKVIVFRDGLSEDQFHNVGRVYEYPRILKGIEAAMKLIKSDAKPPKILIVCAVKRHHTRCFPLGEEPYARDDKTQIATGVKKPTKDSEWNYNPLPGTLITERITYGEGKDFFLYCQNAIKGTARPTHYTILVNELGCKLDDVAQMVSLG